jgi:hypothetical protein
VAYFCKRKLEFQNFALYIIQSWLLGEPLLPQPLDLNPILGGFNPPIQQSTWKELQVFLLKFSIKIYKPYALNIVISQVMGLQK